jgi:hypothetical protein
MGMGPNQESTPKTTRRLAVLVLAPRAAWDVISMDKVHLRQQNSKLAEELVASRPGTSIFIQARIEEW